MKTTDLKTKGSLNPLSISIFLIFSVIFVMLFALGVINIFVFIISMAFSVLLSNSIHIADQWERAVVLRMGKYSGLKGPGLFMIIPIIDRVSTYIDQRVRVSAFKAEQTLTKDTVPVNVDTSKRIFVQNQYHINWLLQLANMMLMILFIIIP